MDVQPMDFVNPSRMAGPHGGAAVMRRGIAWAVSSGSQALGFDKRLEPAGVIRLIRQWGKVLPAAVFECPAAPW
jgi:hypothetical protein